jgi:hypothetical protein
MNTNKELIIESTNRSKSFITRYMDIISKLKLTIYGYNNVNLSKYNNIILNNNNKIVIKLPKIPVYLDNFKNDLKYKKDYTKYNELKLILFNIITKCKNRGIYIKLM